MKTAKYGRSWERSTTLCWPQLEAVDSLQNAHPRVRSHTAGAERNHGERPIVLQRGQHKGVSLFSPPEKAENAHIPWTGEW